MHLHIAAEIQISNQDLLENIKQSLVWLHRRAIKHVELLNMAEPGVKWPFVVKKVLNKSTKWNISVCNFVILDIIQLLNMADQCGFPHRLKMIALDYDSLYICWNWHQLQIPKEWCSRLTQAEHNSALQLMSIGLQCQIMSVLLWLSLQMCGRESRRGVKYFCIKAGFVSRIVACFS